ncbi:MAG: DUF1259 domain-containing protein [Cyclobacteriaceae bacterium]
MKNILQTSLFVITVTLFSGACNDATRKADSKDPSTALNFEKLEEVLGMKGTTKEGEFKVTVAQNDLNVIVDGFKIVPAMGLGSWAAFTSSPQGAMVMGDIVVTETDVKPVQIEVIRQGLSVTAIHNHFVRDKPHVMYMHIGGMGTQEKLAQSVKSVFEKVKELRGINPADGSKTSVENTLDTAWLNTECIKIRTRTDRQRKR